jgi:cytosine/adenosine deaminase-related metal-dependent hydrolase
MVDIRIDGGTVLTLDSEGTVVDDGTVVVDDGKIVAVESSADTRGEYDADQVVDASGHAVLPGFVLPHTHVSDILFRGGVSNERSIYDWLYNVKKPGIHAMTPEDHAVASALYSWEALRAGVTTFVELPDPVFMGGDHDVDAIVDAKLTEYHAAGVRNVYAQTFRDNPDIPDEFRTFIEQLRTTEPSVTDLPLDYALWEVDDVEALLEDQVSEYHDPSPGSRQRVWMAPEHIWTASREGLRRASEFADRHDAMTTTHVSETTHDESGELTNVQYLATADYLGERTVLAHCVHVDERDVRLLSTTDTKVAHNPLTNLVLGSGIAPVPTMDAAGVTVGLGTDNPSANDTIHPLSDARYAALVHRGHRRDAGAVTAERALEMVTRDGARAIGREDELGSIEEGKRGDLVLVDLDYPHLTPCQNVAPTLVKQAQGHEIDTVLCEGEVVVENGRVPGVQTRHPDLLSTAERHARAVIERSGLDGVLDRDWPRRSRR